MPDPLHITFHNLDNKYKFKLGTFYFSSLGISGGVLTNEEAYNFLKSIDHGYQPDLINYRLLLDPNEEYPGIDIVVEIPKLSNLKFKNNGSRNKFTPSFVLETTIKISPPESKQPPPVTETNQMEVDYEDDSNLPVQNETTQLPNQEPMQNETAQSPIVETATEPNAMLGDVSESGVDISSEEEATRKTTIGNPSGLKRKKKNTLGGGPVQNEDYSRQKKQERISEHQSRRKTQS
jgi:hypothetical protein